MNLKEFAQQELDFIDGCKDRYPPEILAALAEFGARISKCRTLNTMSVATYEMSEYLYWSPKTKELTKAFRAKQLAKSLEEFDKKTEFIKTVEESGMRYI